MQLALDFHPGSVAPADPRCISYTFVRATPSGGSPTIGFRANFTFQCFQCTSCVTFNRVACLCFIELEIDSA